MTASSEACRTGAPGREEKLLRALFDAALDAVSAERCLPANLRFEDRAAWPGRRLHVVGAGKAAAAMARVVERRWQASGRDASDLEGLVVTPYRHGVPCRRIEVVEAAHPVPDAAGARAARRILDRATGLQAGDTLLCLISGGASALLSLPPSDVTPPITLEDKRSVNRDLLSSGAAIGEMNAVRKHLSAIKGGRLAAAAHPARCVTLAISDVPGDDPAIIGSGPTVADPTSLADAREILERFGVTPPRSVAEALRRPEMETIKASDPRVEGNEIRIVANAHDALAAAAAMAGRAGVRPLVLGDSVEGEAREVALVMAAVAQQIAAHREPFSPPCVLLSGGETTVTVRGDGRGGRNAEFLLALAVGLRRLPAPAPIRALACDTDGIDGSEDNAGCSLTPRMLTEALEARHDPRPYLWGNDAYSWFAARDGLVITGPTRTNVNDFRAILVGNLPGQTTRSASE